ncbi:hypothetical protein T265_06137 [Opisthorchis viverrini]|uniref:Chromo domain-containing protein n=1 Tax=Opisthorchis viverrini TaxID=6198 RepID=A0A074ZLH2_OPIVI|nr:hypothetical protein T265_06137 [Opisthorchis viverrini]KER26632.1 hypothetical protein T265_06137 [Opisthorchis viverrini]
MKRSETRGTDDLYLVENIVDRRVKRGRVEYRVRWKGFPPEQDSWEPFTSLREPCFALIQDFHNRRSLHEKRRYTLPIVNSPTKPADRASPETYSTSSFEKEPKIKPDTSLLEKPSTSTRGHTHSRGSKNHSEVHQGSLPFRSVIDSPYSGAISLNSTCLLATSGNDNALRMLTTPAENSTTERLGPGFGTIDGHRVNSRFVRDSVLDGAVSSVSSTSSTSEKTFRAPSNSSTKRSSSSAKRKSGSSVVSVVSDQAAVQSGSSRTKGSTATVKQPTPSTDDTSNLNSHSGRTSKADRTPTKEGKSVVSSDEPHPETNRKSVTIMLEAPPSQEFHSTKEIQIHQPNSLPEKVSTGKRFAKPSTTPKKASIKNLVGPPKEVGKIPAHPVPDSHVAKVTDVILQLRESRRRPVQSMILGLCSRQYNLSDQEVLAVLNYLVYQGQLHEIHFTNGISYRSNPRIVARGDLSYPTNLSARIKAKYVTGMKKKKSVVGAQSHIKRLSQADCDPNTGTKRLRQETTQVTAQPDRCFAQNNRCASMGHSLFGRVLKPTTIPDSVPSYLPGLRTDTRVTNVDTAETKQNHVLPVNRLVPPYQEPYVPQTPHTDRRNLLIPPSSPIRESHFESQFNSLPHRRNGQPPLPNEHHPVPASGDFDTSGATPSYIKVSANGSDSMNPSNSTPNLLTVSRRSSVRQTEAVYKFKSILVKKNITGCFTEVLEELTTVLNQAVYDTSRLIMISGMGTVFGAGLDLTILTGPLPHRSGSNSTSKFPCPSSATSSGSGISTNGSSYHDPTRFHPSDRENGDQRVIGDSNGSMYCCCCSNDSQQAIPLLGQKSAQCQTSMHSHHSCLAPPDPLVSQQLGAALRAFLLTLASFPKPVVVGVNGPAMGLAVAMLPLCDLVYVSDSATFQLPYTRLGQTPEGGSSFTLGALIGLPLANELLLAGRKLSAREAVQRGFVSDLLYPKSFKQELVMRCQKLAATSSMALEMTKCIVRTQHRDRIEIVINTECRKLVECWQTAAFRRAAIDFLLTDMGDFL